MMRVGVGFVLGVAVAAVATLLGGVGVTDCSEVREQYYQYVQDIRVDSELELVAEAVALARSNKECFGRTELDTLPAVPRGGS